MIAQFLTA